MSIVPSAQGIGAKLAALLGGPAEQAGLQAGEMAGTGFSSGLGRIVKVLALPALAVGIGAGLVKLGSDFQTAFNKIRVDTGQTGAALGGLENSFKRVLASGPESINEVSLAISKLRVGLGLTGKPLESLATQVLDLSRITKTDLATNLDSVSQLFNNFGIAAGAQAGKLNELFRASQATGVSVATLAGAMASSGGVLRTAGFSFESSAAILGLLAKSGVSVTTIMPALGKAIKEAAKAGLTADQVFRSAFDAIKNAPNDTAAAGDAIQVFGAKAGPKLAALIREGKLSYEDLARTIATGTDTITAAASQTETLSVKWHTFINSLKVAVQPLATAVLGLAINALGALAPALQKIAPLFAQIGPALVPVVTGIKLFFATVTGGTASKAGLGDWAKPIITAGKQVGVIFDGLVKAGRDLFASLKRIDWSAVFTQAKVALAPFVEAFKQLAVAVFDFAVKAWPAVLSAIKDALPVLKDIAVLVGVTVLGAIRALTVVVDVLKDHMTILVPVLEAVAVAFLAFKATNAVISGVKRVTDAFGLIVTKGKLVTTAVTDVGTKLADFFAARGGFADTIGVRFLQLGDLIGGIGTKADGSRSLVGRLFDAIVTKSDGTRTAIGNLLTSLGQLVGAATEKILVKIGITTTLDDAATNVGTNAAGTAGGEVTVGLIPKLKKWIQSWGPALGVLTTKILGSGAFVGIAGVVIPATIYSFAFPQDVPIIATPSEIGNMTFHIFGFDTNQIIPKIKDAIQKAWTGAWKTTNAADLTGAVGDWLSRSARANVGKTFDFGALAQNVLDFFTKDLKLGDPSKVADWPGKIVKWVEDALGGGIRQVIDDVRTWIGDFVGGLNFDFVGTIVSSLFGGSSAKSAGGATAPVATIDTGWLDKAFQPVVDWITNLPGKIAALIPDPILWLVTKGVEIVQGFVAGIVVGATSVWDFFVNLPNTILGLLTSAGTWLLGTGLSVIVGLYSGIITGANFVWGFFTSLPGRILGFLTAAGTWLLQTGIAILSGLANGLVIGAVAVFNFFATLPGRIIGAIPNLGGILVQAGRDIIDGLRRGIESGFGVVKSILDRLTSLIPSWKPIATDHLLLRPAGFAVMRGLADGITAGMAGVNKVLNDATTLVTDAARNIGTNAVPKLADAFHTPDLKAPTFPKLKVPTVQALDAQVHAHWLLDVAPTVKPLETEIQAHWAVNVAPAVPKLDSQIDAHWAVDAPPTLPPLDSQIHARWIVGIAPVVAPLDAEIQARWNVGVAPSVPELQSQIATHWVVDATPTIPSLAAQIQAHWLVDVAPTIPPLEVRAHWLVDTAPVVPPLETEILAHWVVPKLDLATTAPVIAPAPVTAPVGAPAPSVNPRQLAALSVATPAPTPAPVAKTRDVNFNGPISTTSPPELATAVADELAWMDKTDGSI